MPITGIHHVQLAMPVGGEDLARRFYRDVLGLPERLKPAHLASRGGCWFEAHAAKIHLGVEADFRPATKAHPALLVADLGAIIDACRVLGLDVVPAEPLEGRERVYVKDPFGNRLELIADDRK